MFDLDKLSEESKRLNDEKIYISLFEIYVKNFVSDEVLTSRQFFELYRQFGIAYSEYLNS